MSVSAEVEAYIKKTYQGTDSRFLDVPGSGHYGDRTKCTEEGMFHPGEPRSRSRFFFSCVMIITNGGPCGAELEPRSLTLAWVRTPGLPVYFDWGTNGGYDWEFEHW